MRAVCLFKAPSSFTEKRVPQVSYFLHMLPDGKDYPTPHFHSFSRFRLTEARRVC